jgi:hypothetical protein
MILATNKQQNKTEGENTERKEEGKTKTDKRKTK